MGQVFVLRFDVRSNRVKNHYNDFVCAQCNTALQIFASYKYTWLLFCYFHSRVSKNSMLSHVHLLYFRQKTIQTLDKRIIGLTTYVSSFTSKSKVVMQQITFLVKKFLLFLNWRMPDKIDGKSNEKIRPKDKYQYILYCISIQYCMFNYTYTRNPASRASKRPRLVAMYIE